jgi:sugar/nucleoside kinase (ribokinase family)
MWYGNPVNYRIRPEEAPTNISCIHRVWMHLSCKPSIFRKSVRKVINKEKIKGGRAMIEVK